MSSPNTDRFTLTLSPGRNPGESGDRAIQELTVLLRLLNQARVPITVGVNESLPEGMSLWQPVIDCRSGVSELKVWNGSDLI